AFISIRATIVAIILYAAIKIAKTAIIDKTTFWIMLIGVPALFFIHPVLAIFLGALTGTISTVVKRRLGYNIQLKKNRAKDTADITPDYFMGEGI
ncbi:MAG: chromate transporter, partial [Bacillus sp. (in: Bacteria)]|nr:chromate transporter [Bacillus sp. (in: firmicutes)]